jgi:hypothetical protein
MTAMPLDYGSEHGRFALQRQIKMRPEKFEAGMFGADAPARTPLTRWERLSFLCGEARSSLPA